MNLTPSDKSHTTPMYKGAEDDDVVPDLGSVAAD